MNPAALPQKRPISASIAQNEIDRRQRIVRADHVILERKPDTGATSVVIDGQQVHIPHFAKVSCGLASDRALPTVTITIHAKRVQITAERLDIEGADQ